MPASTDSSNATPFTLSLPTARERQHSRSHSTTVDSLVSNADERTRLLSVGQHSFGTDTGGPFTPRSLRRKSAFLSDLISSHTHSAFEPGDEIASPSGTAPHIARGYDGEFREDLEGESGNGVRQWYDNYSAIDWLHDQIKHAIRLRRLRSRKGEGIRGYLTNLFDGAQGWLLVSLVGLGTACVAWAIITAEMVLFDLKEGYCINGARLPKRFCCSTLGTSLVEECSAWRTWGAVYSDWQQVEDDSWVVNFTAQVVIAVLFSTFASILTIYLSASTGVYSSKDSPSVPFPGFSPHFPTRNLPDSVASSSGESDEPTMLQLPTPRPRKVMYFAAGSGIPELKCILSGFVIRGYLGAFTLVAKSVGLTFSVASGLSLGKEGPMVHIASCVGNILSRFAPKYDRNEGKRREIISAACAAGVAVSFGAPIGGTLFSLEEVSSFFPPKVMWRSFFCAMVAATFLKLFDPFGTGKIVLFAVTYDRDWKTFELLGFLLLGLFGGVYGALFCKANIWWTRNVRNKYLKQTPIVEVALVTIATAAVSLSNPFLRMGGTELVAALFQECHVDGLGDAAHELCVSSPELVGQLVGSIGFALVLKAVLTVVTFGIKLPAGIFIPTLAVGACAGRIAGLLVELLHARAPTLFDACRLANDQGPLPFGQACVIPGVWAMVGAAAALAGVTRTTVSLAVIMFELTSSLTYTVPVMLAVLVSKTAADMIEPRSIYDLVIELSELPFLDPKVEYVHESTPGDIMDSKALYISLEADNTIGSLRDLLAQLYDQGGVGFPVLGHESEGLRMFGFISSKELEHGLANAFVSPLDTPCTFRTAMASHKRTPVPDSKFATPSGYDFSYLMDSAPLALNARSPMELVHELFVKLGTRYLVLVDDHACYLGTLEKNRYLAYLAYLNKKKEDGHFPTRATMTSRA